MPGKGRPRLTPKELQARIDQYCARYGVTPNADGLPPFPSGKRETPQHRAWIAVYKAHNRLGRRARGQCERCSAQAASGSVFCETHRGDGSADGRYIALDARGGARTSQSGRCPICGRKVELGAVLDERCGQFVKVAEALGIRGFERLRQHVWPRQSKALRRRS